MPPIVYSVGSNWIAGQMGSQDIGDNAARTGIWNNIQTCMGSRIFNRPCTSYTFVSRMYSIKLRSAALS
ncbi:uncharacterized protein P884DRAFT_260210 [Thermothelomyces heterothallicus CBS 202.75]|uniref:uncharacterized protein n=1 Tax=Thermothelomyces heterothallicus CBS 202.75 TaxID=1149848 RepID=UPI0037437A71